LSYAAGKGPKRAEQVAGLSNNRFANKGRKDEDGEHLTTGSKFQKTKTKGMHQV